ncbi:MAG: Ig-like domain-containing protein, partial [Patescibacteria group bacterium]
NKVIDSERDEVALTGTSTLTVDSSDTYSYRFSAGSKHVDCSVKTVMVEGDIDADALITNDTTPTLSGSASGTKTVRVVVRTSDATNQIVYESKDLKLKRGDWTITLPRALDRGTYQVELHGAKDLKLNTITERTLLIGSGTGSSTTGGSLSISSIPLLTGGAASAGSSVPIAYVQLTNNSARATSITSFRLVQNGTAPAAAVLGFSTSDNLGGSRTMTGGIEGRTPFVNGSAFIPLEATILPGQFRIFTLKAQLSRTSMSYAGTTLMIDVSGVDTNGKINGLLPLRGTTWTLI